MGDRQCLSEMFVFDCVNREGKETADVSKVVEGVQRDLCSVLEAHLACCGPDEDR